MYRSPTLFFLFLSAACLNIFCSPYRHLQKMASDPSCVQKFKPDFNHAIYKTYIDAAGKHLSGLLLMKYMPDSSVRIVFTNEMGFGFFDFGFGPGDQFSVHQIIPQMNKNGLINMLRKDFDLLLFKNMPGNTAYARTDSNLIYYAFPQAEGINYYITDIHCKHLVKMQIASDKKPRMEAYMYLHASDSAPDSLFIRHLNFIHFTISLKKLEPLAPE
jgi:hypothetical protein